jgi:hypothetical protein
VHATVDVKYLVQQNTCVVSACPKHDNDYLIESLLNEEDEQRFVWKRRWSTGGIPTINLERSSGGETIRALASEVKAAFHLKPTWAEANGAWASAIHASISHSTKILITDWEKSCVLNGYVASLMLLTTVRFDSIQSNHPKLANEMRESWRQAWQSKRFSLLAS